MRQVSIPWPESGGTEAALRRLLELAGERALLVLEVPGGTDGEPADPRLLERLRAARAVTAVVAAGRLAGGVLEVALSCDLLYLREDAALDAGGAGEVPSPSVVPAFGRAGRTALRRLLLEPTPVTAQEALGLGVAAGVLAADEPLPVPADASFAALAAARDLTRSGAPPTVRLALERAAFELLFAKGDPVEGAQAFLEKRPPRFDTG